MLVLVFKGSSMFLYSKEGVIQGDFMSMLMYVIGSYFTSDPFAS